MENKKLQNSTKVIDGIYKVKLPFNIGYTLVAVKEFLEHNQMLVYYYDYLSNEIPKDQTKEIEENKILMSPSLYTGRSPNRGKEKWIFYKELPNLQYFNELPALKGSGIVFEEKWPKITYWRFVEDLAMKEYRKEYDKLPIKQVQHLGLWLNINKDFLELYAALVLLRKRNIDYTIYEKDIHPYSKNILRHVENVIYYDIIPKEYLNKIIPADKVPW